MNASFKIDTLVATGTPLKEDIPKFLPEPTETKQVELVGHTVEHTSSQYHSQSYMHNNQDHPSSSHNIYGRTFGQTPLCDNRRYEYVTSRQINHYATDSQTRGRFDVGMQDFRAEWHEFTGTSVFQKCQEDVMSAWLTFVNSRTETLGNHPTAGDLNHDHVPNSSTGRGNLQNVDNGGNHLQNTNLLCKYNFLLIM